MTIQRDPATLCKVCEDPNKYIIARGMCKKCYDKWYVANKDNPEIKTQRSHKRKHSVKDTRPFPIPQVITVWECSDGREFGSETEACRHELELFRNG